MRILYHHRTASRDGQAVHIDEMVEALVGLGHEIRIVGPSIDGRAPVGSKVGWIHWLKSSFPKSIYELLELSYSSVALARLAHEIYQFRPHVIYERYNLFLLSGVIAKRWFRVPLLLEVNGPVALERSRFGGLALTRLAQWSEHTAWRGADRVLPVTHVLADHIVASGVGPDRIAVIANAINEAHFVAAPSQDVAKAKLGMSGKLILGFTGFIREWHGVDRVMQWMALPHVASATHLLVVGDGPAKQKLEQLARALGLTHRVTFAGLIERERIPEYLAAFDIALQPAVVPYASPLKIFEYLVLGKAIVAPRQPNIQEILVDGQNAILFDPDDPKGLDAALDLLTGNDRLRADLGMNAAKTIGERGFTWRENAVRVTKMCEQIVASRGILDERLDH